MENLCRIGRKEKERTGRSRKTRFSAIQNQNFHKDFQRFQIKQTEVTTIIKVATIKVVLTLASFFEKSCVKAPVRIQDELISINDEVFASCCSLKLKETRFFFGKFHHEYN